MHAVLDKIELLKNIIISHNIIDVFKSQTYHEINRSQSLNANITFAYREYDFLNIYFIYGR